MKKRLSPFERLLRAVENELFDLALELQRTPAEKLNTDFVLGYRAALNVILERALAIYRGSFPASLIFLDERTEDATELLREALGRLEREG